VGVFLANHLCLRSLQASGIDAELSVGLSLGEYNHLVDIGALTFAEALLLVDARGKLYDAGPEGAMVSIFPLDLDAVAEVISRASACGIVEIVSFNSPTQHVIAGERPAVDNALAILEEEHFVDAVRIEDRIPMHSSVFAPVAMRFRHELERVSWCSPRRAYIPNVQGRLIAAPSIDFLVDALTQHVCRPVLWRQSLEAIAERYRDLIFVEVGPRAILHNLLQRTWLPYPRFKVDTDGDLLANFASLVVDLGNGSERG
jgi:[acyl-carrier-protein] S-malonyltransferase